MHAVYNSEKSPGDGYEACTVVITINSTDEPNVPVREGTVRISELKGRWILSYISRERTKVSFTVRCNPGGNIPKSIANMTSRNFPYKTLLGMKKTETLDKYIEAAGISGAGKEIERYITAGILKP